MGSNTAVTASEAYLRLTSFALDAAHSYGQRTEKASSSPLVVTGFATVPLAELAGLFAGLTSEFLDGNLSEDAALRVLSRLCTRAQSTPALLTWVDGALDAIGYVVPAL